MPAKYKDYPIYTYDEPVTYNDFSGGINTDPSNEHLLANEMRDCLNMHYKSAALVKRRGASLLCTISCEDELFNIQGVFVFTYKITYIIIAADGKLYKGFYTPNSTIELSRLSIDISKPHTYDLYDPLNLTEGLEVRIDESLNTQHEGFIYEYLLTGQGLKKQINPSNYLGEFINLPEFTDIYPGNIVELQEKKYELNYTSSALNYLDKLQEEDKKFTLKITTPLSTYDDIEITQDENGNDISTLIKKHYWIPLDEYNILYKDTIKTTSDPVAKNANHAPLIYNTTNLDSDNLHWVIDPVSSRKDNWSPQIINYNTGDCRFYNSTAYICIKEHHSFNSLPSDIIASPYLIWTLCDERQDLIFQNYLPVEAATYKNKLYIATGTRFIQIEIADNNLQASIVTPYFCNNSEIVNIGYNFLSPYPELCTTTQYNQAITSITGLLAIKQQDGNYILTPRMNFANNETEKDYYFKWEKLINSEWKTIISYKDNLIDTTDYLPDDNGEYYFNEVDKLYELITDDSFTGIRYNKINSTIKKECFTLSVNDADIYQYRVSFAKSFDKPSSIVETWDFNHTLYKVGDLVSVKESEGAKEKIYECVKEHCPKELIFEDVEYEFEYTISPKYHETYYVGIYKVNGDGTYQIKTSDTPRFCTHTLTKQGLSLYEKNGDTYTYKQSIVETLHTKIQQGYMYWSEVYTEEEEQGYDITTGKEITIKDWTVNKVDGEYFGQATSVLFTDINIEDTFNVIQSCRKITSDGNKFLLYGDKYNSGSWYKTIIDNPAYITHRGSLSFKTTKNEELLKVIPFNGALIAFANSEDIGGSIHLITGNGDDYDDQSGYYSPYKRVTINSNISCDNEKTIQVCENLLVFKYFSNVYYIIGSELNNEVVSVYSCNDRIKHENNFVDIPWDDNDCISEVTEDYYALLWKEKYHIENGDLIQDRPALKIKMYYKLGFQLNEKILYPWLRDESEYFNIDHIIYIKGKPVYLYANSLITFNENTYTDFGKEYLCMIHFRGEDIGYPKLYKLLSSVLVYYHHNQYSKIDFDLVIRNEAGHILLDSSSKRISLQDLRALRSGDMLMNSSTRLDSTILDSKVYNTTYKFPCLLADTLITAKNDKEFSLSSITYNYTTSDTPDMTSYDLYTNIIRPKEVK